MMICVKTRTTFHVELSVVYLKYQDSFTLLAKWDEVITLPRQELLWAQNASTQMGIKFSSNE